MTRRSVRAASTAATLGLCIALGAAILPAQASTLATAVPAATTPGVTLETHIQNIGWTTWVGSTGQSWNLEAIRLTQRNNQVLCGKAHVAELGWLTAKCTTGIGTKIVLGTTGQNRALEALELWVPGYHFSTRAHVRNIGWQPKQTATYAGQHLTVGTTGRGLAMEAVEIQYFNW